MKTRQTARAGSLIHLLVLGSEPVSEGPHGCDYAWNADYTSYRCLPHRWNPRGGDHAYAEWQSRDVGGEYDADEEEMAQ